MNAVIRVFWCVHGRGRACGRQMRANQTRGWRCSTRSWRVELYSFQQLFQTLNITRSARDNGHGAWHFGKQRSQLAARRHRFGAHVCVYFRAFSRTVCADVLLWRHGCSSNSFFARLALVAFVSGDSFFRCRAFTFWSMRSSRLNARRLANAL